MPTLTAVHLRRLGAALFAAAGTPQPTADYVAWSLVESNLAGHDSHGISRVLSYIQWIRDGLLAPAAQPDIMQETAATAMVDGHRTFGQVAARFGMEVAIRKAQQAGLAAVGVVNCHHAGRIGEYSLMAAEAGMIGMVTVGGANAPGAVVPYGGTRPALGTNPWSFAVPAGDFPPVLVDFATSAVAAGKVHLARAKGEPLPPGSILDRTGQPSVNPEDFFAGGMLLPFGGHKGYALGLMADLLAGPLVGNEAFALGIPTDGIFMLVINAAAFRPLPEFRQAVDARLAKVQSVPPAAGFDAVMIPGEPERRAKEQRSAAGIEIPETTWQALRQLAATLNVDIAPPAESS